MAAKHMAPKGTEPTSEKYESNTGAGEKSDSRGEAVRNDRSPSGEATSSNYSPRSAATSSSSSEPHRQAKRHPGRTALVVVIAVVVAAAIVIAAVPSARAAVTGLLQPQAQEEPAEQSSEDENSSNAEAAESNSNQDEATTSTDDADATTSDTAEKQAAEEETEPEPVDDDSPYDATADATTYTTSAGISVTAAPGFESTTTASALDSALTNLTNRGYTVAFVMYDLSTGKGASYNTSAMMYPASSIKAAYCTWILESTGGSVSSSTAVTIENCLVNSNNDAFHSLIDAYGLPTYASWLAQYAPETSPKARVYYYPEVSADGLTNLWKEIYRYGASGEGGSSLLAQCLAASNHSAMGGLLRDKYTVWSKPGWYPADGSGLQATNDTGIVFSDCGDYVYVVLTNVPDDFSSVFPLIGALNATHGKICGGHSALYVNDNTAVSGGEE